MDSTWTANGKITTRLYRRRLGDVVGHDFCQATAVLFVEVLLRMTAGNHAHASQHGHGQRTCAQACLTAYLHGFAQPRASLKMMHPVVLRAVQAKNAAPSKLGPARQHQQRPLCARWRARRVSAAEHTQTCGLVENSVCPQQWRSNLPLQALRGPQSQEYANGARRRDQDGGLTQAPPWPLRRFSFAVLPCPSPRLDFAKLVQSRKKASVLLCCPLAGGATIRFHP